MNRLGKKSKANKKNNAELKQIFTKLGIDFCEICGCRFGLTWAHSRKRRFITTDEMMKHVALLCLPHHQEIERLPSLAMFQKVTEIIEKRDSL